MFRFVFIVLLLTIPPTLPSTESSQSGDAADRAAIKAVLDAHGAAWTRGDADAATAILTEDADWVSGSGKVLVGRPAILQMHRDMLSGAAKGTQHSHPGTSLDLASSVAEYPCCIRRRAAETRSL